MNVTQKQLDELIRLITKTVLKEYSSMMTSSDEQDIDPHTADDGVKPDDAKTAVEKSKDERMKRLAQKNQLDQAKQELQTAKKERDFQKQNVDKTNRFEIPQLNKKVQAIASGKIAENIRKLSS